MADAHGDGEPPCDVLEIAFLDEEHQFLNRVVFLIDERRVECWVEGDPNVAMSEVPPDPGRPKKDRSFPPRWRIRIQGEKGAPSNGEILDSITAEEGATSRAKLCEAAREWVRFHD